MKRTVWAVVGAALVWAACGGSEGGGSGQPDPVNPGTGTPDAGTATPPPDAGTVQPPPPPPPQTDGGTPPPAAAYPWPEDARTNLTSKYNLEKSFGEVKAFHVDQAHNIWLLNGGRIGVLRASDAKVVKTSSPIGQAQLYPELPAFTICGGSAGRAYVGYLAYEFTTEEGNKSYPGHPERLKGDVDAVRLDGDAINLEAHVMFVNTNDHHYDETRSILSCTRVMDGPMKGELYFGSNHGVTRVREPAGPWPVDADPAVKQQKHYNDHRHPAWYKYANTACDIGLEQCWIDSNSNGVKECGGADYCEKGSIRSGNHYGLSITPEGDVFMGATWKLAIMTPNADANGLDDRDGGTWDRVGGANATVRKLDIYRDLSVLESGGKDSWRATAKSHNGLLFAGSDTIGLWHLRQRSMSSGKWGKIGEGIVGNNVTALQATKNGSLYIGTPTGLFKLDTVKAEASLMPPAYDTPPTDPVDAFSAVSGITGAVRRIVYDPSVTPTALYVHTADGLFLLRGE